MFVDDTTTTTAGADSQTKRQEYLPNDWRRVSRCTEIDLKVDKEKTTTMMIFAARQRKMLESWYSCHGVILTCTK